MSKHGWKESSPGCSQGRSIYPLIKHSFQKNWITKHPRHTANTKAQDISVIYRNWNSSCDTFFIDIINCVTHLMSSCGECSLTIFITQNVGCKPCLVHTFLILLWTLNCSFYQRLFSRVLNTKQLTRLYSWLAVLMGYYFTCEVQQNKNVTGKRLVWDSLYQIIQSTWH